MVKDTVQREVWSQLSFYVRKRISPGHLNPTLPLFVVSVSPFYSCCTSKLPAVHSLKIYGATLHANHSIASYNVCLEKYWTRQWRDVFELLYTSLSVTHIVPALSLNSSSLSQQLRTLKEEVMVMVPLLCVCPTSPLSSCCLQCSYNWRGCSRGVVRDESAADYFKLQYTINGYYVLILNWSIFWHCLK